LLPLWCNDRTLRIFARCVAAAATALAFVAFGVGATSAAPPPDSCDGQWTAPSPLQFVQENGYYVTLYLNQQGTKITGKAGYQIGRKVTTGNVIGGINGNRFFARIYWTASGGRGIGVYIGEIGPWAWIFQGRTYDQQATPAVIKSFNSSKATLFYCAPVPGKAEVVRTAVPYDDYQVEFNRFTKAGYRPVWIDGFRSVGKTWINAIFRPDDGQTPWVARHNLTGTQYQAEFEKWTTAGYRPLQVESYPVADGIRYAAIFVKTAGPPFLAYHGRSEADHQSRFNQLTTQGWVPVNISVTPWGGARYYTALYEKKDVGSFAAWQVLAASQYQAQINQQAAAGRKLVYLNAYNDPSGSRFTAIWYSNAAVPYARHGIDPLDYFALAKAQRARGLLTRAVTGYTEGTNLRYAGFWSS
jgi:hypothetical protein